MVTETMKGHLGWILEKKEAITAVCLGYGNRKTGHSITHGSRQQRGYEVCSPRGEASAVCENQHINLLEKCFFSLG